MICVHVFAGVGGGGAVSLDFNSVTNFSPGLNKRR